MERERLLPHARLKNTNVHHSQVACARRQLPQTAPPFCNPMNSLAFSAENRLRLLNSFAPSFDHRQPHNNKHSHQIGTPTGANKASAHPFVLCIPGGRQWRDLSSWLAHFNIVVNAYFQNPSNSTLILLIGRLITLRCS